MKSFVVRIKDFFQMNRGNQYGDENFLADKRRLVIPLYQREFKWESSKIDCLIRDISQRDKFLGIAILDETENAYEIVDGQQRITTCFLILACIYNLLKGHPMEQQSVLKLLQPHSGTFVLTNHSVGEFATLANDMITIDILERDDIYFQKEDFNNAYNIIHEYLKTINLRDFQNKLKDCGLLVMINEHSPSTSSIEQVFLDINEKSQLLDAGDIFKGHCFAIFSRDLHGMLKGKWVQLKKVAAMFHRKFGYADLSQYLFHFLLFSEDKSLPEHLSPGGKHFLIGKTSDEVDTLISSMISYGEDIIAFRESVNKIDYRFVDVCPNSQDYKGTDDHITMKIMVKEILDSTKAVYQKAPMFMLIHALKTQKHQDLTHDDLRRLITNLYVYSNLFLIAKSGRKSKNDIDHTVKVAMNADSNPIKSAVSAAKELRTAMAAEFSMKPSYKWDALAFIYSIIDHYMSPKNWLVKKYTKESGLTLEHFIISDHKKTLVHWNDGEDSFSFTTNKAYKTRTINYLILPGVLNGLLEHNDIMRKIEQIEEWYERHDALIPTHVEVFISHIKNLDTYEMLASHKGKDKERAEIEASYNEFIEEYFGEEQQNNLLLKLTEMFNQAFRNELSPQRLS